MITVLYNIHLNQVSYGGVMMRAQMLWVPA